MTYLHLRNIGVGRGFTTVLTSDARLGLAQVLASGVEGRVGHCEGCVDVLKRRG